MRNVRNFWVALEVDGKKEDVGTGPRSRDGGFFCKIKQRRNGSVADNEVVVRGVARGDILDLTVLVRGQPIYQCKTRR